jgi:DNA-binding transcriptional MerR regulator
MPIGRFAKCCRLSIKALRYYDEQGLLEPAYVDPHTGYRYYKARQARDAVMIGMLRALGIPLATVAELLRSPGADFGRILERERRRIATDLAQRQQALRSIERIARVGQLMPYEIALRMQPACVVAMKSCVTVPERMVRDSGSLVYELMDELGEAGRKYRDPVMCINEDPDREDKIIVHACIGVDSPYPDLRHAQIVELPAGPVAWLTHRGAYEELGLAYHALFAWTQERGHEQSGAMREIYLNDPAEVSTDDLETQVLLPIRSNI